MKEWQNFVSKRIFYFFLNLKYLELSRKISEQMNYAIFNILFYMLDSFKKTKVY